MKAEIKVMATINQATKGMTNAQQIQLMEILLGLINLKIAHLKGELNNDDETR